MNHPQPSGRPLHTSYETIVIGHGNHAAIEIPAANVARLGGSKRVPLRVTVNGHKYQSTATGVDGKCMVVFPTQDREASKTKAGDRITVTLELDAGYRNVVIHQELESALIKTGLIDKFNKLTYSRRKEYARQVQDAKMDDTRIRRIEKIIASLRILE